MSHLSRSISTLPKAKIKIEEHRKLQVPHYWWNYHEAVSQSDYCITTNCLENLNLRLKTKVGVGYCSRNKAYKTLKDFHLEFISKYTAKVAKNKMPLIKKSTVLGKLN